MIAVLGVWVLLNGWWFLSLRHPLETSVGGWYDTIDAQLSPANTFIHVSCYVLIAAGVLVAFVSFLGCMSALSSSKSLLYIVSVFLSQQKYLKKVYIK